MEPLKEKSFDLKGSVPNSTSAPETEQETPSASSENVLNEPASALLKKTTSKSSKKGTDGAEKKQSVQQRCEEAGKQRSENDKEDHKTYNNKEAIRTLAIHLACDPKFLDIMRGNMLENSDSVVWLAYDWVANVHIPGRYINSDSFTAWMASFWAHSRSQIIERAAAIYHALPPEYKTRCSEHVIAPKSDQQDREALEKLQKDCFLFHEHQRRLMAVAKQTSHQQYTLAKTATLEFLEVVSSDQQIFLGKLYLLRQAELECQSKLNERRFEFNVVELIDRLLNSVGMGPVDGQLNLDEERFKSPSYPYEKVRSIIQEREKFTLDYVVQDLAKTPAVSKIVPTRPEYQLRPAPDTPVDAKIFDSCLKELDDTLCNALNATFGKINAVQFATNLRFIISIIARPQMLDKPLKTTRWSREGGIAAEKVSHYELFVDNVYHFKHLFGKLRASRPEKAEAHDHIMLQMMALLAIYYGCLSEPGYLVSVSSYLLSKLSRLYVGKSNIYLDTITVTNIGEVFNNVDGRFIFRPYQKLTITALEAQHTSRLYIAEGARFFNGSIISAYALTMNCDVIKRVSSQNDGEKARIHKFNSLLHWTQSCALTECDQPLIPPGKGHDRRPLSCGARDSRMGMPDYRAEASTNRRDCYACLYDFIDGYLWDHNFGPFYFWFANIFHPNCKAHRGKPSQITG